MSNENQIEVIPPSALESITRGEVDTQIATAHKYPRSMATFKRRATEMATLDEETVSKLHLLAACWRWKVCGRSISPHR